LRRSSSRSALPFSLGIGVPLLNTYYCILYADINSGILDTLGIMAETDWSKVLGWPGYRVYRHEINEQAKTLKL
jgi:hypothetical protein